MTENSFTYNFIVPTAHWLETLVTEMNSVEDLCTLPDQHWYMIDQYFTYFNHFLRSGQKISVDTVTETNDNILTAMLSDKEGSLKNHRPGQPPTLIEITETDEEFHVLLIGEMTHTLLECIDEKCLDATTAIDFEQNRGYDLLLSYSSATSPFASANAKQKRRLAHVIQFSPE